jgi:Fe-S oxidoreductase
VGYQVVLPPQSLCCGRPLYDYGMLDLAKRQLGHILSALQPQMAAGGPIVGLEPSCTAVFRDELLNLFPQDEAAQRWQQQSFTVSIFLTKHIRDYRLPPLHGKALVQRHCHHQAVMGYDADEAVLAKLGLDYEILDSGCCGMAGAFGFEKAHYAVSIKCGERVWLPAVRTATSGTLIIADGFSCRAQIAQNTDRRALHLAQVVHMAVQRDDPQFPHYSSNELRRNSRNRTAEEAVSNQPKEVG